MGKMESQLAISSPNEASSTTSGLHQIELLTKGFHGNPQTIQPVDRAFGCSAYPDSEAPLLKIIPSQHIENGEFL